MQEGREILSLRKTHIVTLVSGIILLIVTLFFTSKWAHRQGLDALKEQSTNSLELYVSYLQGVLEKYEVLPELLATDKRLVNFLSNPGSRERIEAFSRYLEKINRISDAADTYIMDREGLTIAASNWNAPRPFVGRNFYFRPYFQQAMKGYLGRYFALGTTSNQRGYYFAYPVRHEQEILGALVMKINIDSVEEDWVKQGDTFLATDPEGVIFITTNTSWRYRTLYPLDPDIRQKIIDSRRYPEASLKPLSIVAQEKGVAHSLIRIQGSGSGEEKSYLHLTAPMPQAGWVVQILSDTSNVDRFVWRTLIGVSAFFILGLMLVLLFWQRRQRLRERYRYEEEARRMLEDANEILESRVLARTTELTESNIKLRLENDERLKAEKKLRSTRKELVHAAKLAALGQMSAGVSHELNQPLAAIRTYSDNALQYLQKGRSDNATWNLEQISELTERMAKIGNQLKLFARKDNDELEVVALHGSVDGALEILNPSIRKYGTTITIEIEPEDIEVHANNVLLQQVLVNLISNAVQAVEKQVDKMVRVRAVQQNREILLSIEDNGPGIKSKDLEKIFDPFFTTKKPGEGLGLGLTISSRIVREMGGSIKVAKNSGGTRFEIRLQTI